MATTTNYGWTTPDDTDLVKDGAAAIRTLGSSVDTTTKNLNPQTTTGALAYRSATANVNTALPIGSTGQVLTVAAGVPSWATLTDQTPLTTKGDVFTFSTVDARLGVGANGTVLTADSAETTGLKWAALPASGKVLQVVSANIATSVTSTVTDYVDSDLTANITPSSTGSKILVLTTQLISIARSSSGRVGKMRLMRGATELQPSVEADQFGITIASGSTLQTLVHKFTFMYLDSPNTTSSTTYKTQIGLNSATNSATITSNFNSVPGSIILLEIGA